MTVFVEGLLSGASRRPDICSGTCKAVPDTTENKVASPCLRRLTQLTCWF